MSDAITAIVRILHVYTAVLWVGSAALWSMVVAPRLLKNGPPQLRKPIAELALPAVSRFIKIAAILALISGFVLVGMIWGWPNYADAFEVPTYGVWLTLGVVAGIATAIIGFGIVAPTGDKMLAVMKGMTGPPTPEQQTTLEGLGKKAGMMGMLSLTLGSLAVIFMAVAVNVFR